MSKMRDTTSIYIAKYVLILSRTRQDCVQKARLITGLRSHDRNSITIPVGQ